MKRYNKNRQQDSRKSRRGKRIVSEKKGREKRKKNNKITIRKLPKNNNNNNNLRFLNYLAKFHLVSRGFYPRLSNYLVPTIMHSNETPSKLRGMAGRSFIDLVFGPASWNTEPLEFIPITEDNEFYFPEEIERYITSIRGSESKKIFRQTGASRSPILKGEQQVSPKKSESIVSGTGDKEREVRTSTTTTTTSTYTNEYNYPHTREASVQEPFSVAEDPPRKLSSYSRDVDDDDPIRNSFEGSITESRSLSASSIHADSKGINIRKGRDESFKTRPYAPRRVQEETKISDLTEISKETPKRLSDKRSKKRDQPSSATYDMDHIETDTHTDPKRELTTIDSATDKLAGRNIPDLEYEQSHVSNKDHRKRFGFEPTIAQSESARNSPHPVSVSYNYEDNENDDKNALEVHSKVSNTPIDKSDPTIIAQPGSGSSKGDTSYPEDLIVMPRESTRESLIKSIAIDRPESSETVSDSREYQLGRYTMVRDSDTSIVTAINKINKQQFFQTTKADHELGQTSTAKESGVTMNIGKLEVRIVNDSKSKKPVPTVRSASSRESGRQQQPPPASPGIDSRSLNISYFWKHKLRI